MNLKEALTKPVEPTPSPGPKAQEKEEGKVRTREETGDPRIDHVRGDEEMGADQHQVTSDGSEEP